MARFLPDLDPTVMIVRCVNDRMVTSGHTHRSSYAKLVNNGDIHVTYSQNIPMDSSQSIYAVCRQFLATKSTHLWVSTVFEFVHRLLSILLYALIDYEFCIQSYHYVIVLLLVPERFRRSIYTDTWKYSNTYRRLLWICYVCYTRHFEIYHFYEILETRLGLD